MCKAAFSTLSLLNHTEQHILYFNICIANWADMVWNLICLQIAPPWHSRSLSPKVVWIYRYEWWCAAWRRCWSGRPTHVGPGSVIFQWAWIWLGVSAPTHPQNQGRDLLWHLHQAAGSKCVFLIFCWVVRWNSRMKTFLDKSRIRDNEAHSSEINCFRTFKETWYNLYRD